MLPTAASQRSHDTDHRSAAAAAENVKEGARNGGVQLGPQHSRKGNKVGAGEQSRNIVRRACAASVVLPIPPGPYNTHRCPVF